MRGDLVGLGLSRHERRVQHPAHLRREVVGVESLERFDLPFQQTAQRVIDAGQAALQESGGEQQRVLLGVEAQRYPEKPAERADVRRNAVCEPGLGGSPIGTA